MSGHVPTGGDGAGRVPAASDPGRTVPWEVHRLIPGMAPSCRGATRSAYTGICVSRVSDRG